MSEQLSPEERYAVVVKEVLREMEYDIEDGDLAVIEACYVAHRRLSTLEITEFQADQLIRQGKMQETLYMEGVKAGMNEYAAIIEPYYAVGLGRLSNMLEAIGAVPAQEREDDGQG